jgi:hypothetical protein
MMRFIRPRLRVPVVTAVAGTVFAAAWVVRGGPVWWLSIMIEAGSLARAIALYIWSGDDTDGGALLGSRADERQKFISLRSGALAGYLAVVAAFIGLTVAIAIRATWWWPFAVMLAVTGLGYLFGLWLYGSREGTPADAADAGQEARSPVSR